MSHASIRNDLSGVLPEINASDVSVPVISAPSWDNLEEFIRFCGTAGRITGGTINVAGTNITVDSGTGIIRTSSSEIGELKFFDFPGLGATAIPGNTVRYVGISYNAGNPVVEVRTTDNWNYYDNFPLGFAANTGGVVHIAQNGREFSDQLGRLIRRFYGTRPYERDERAGGLVIGETGTRNVTLTAGTLWDRSNDFDIAAIDTSGAGRFDLYYRDGGTDFTVVGAQSQWPNTQYDDGDGVLGTLAAAQYACLWWYVETDGGLVCLYGRGAHNTLAQATAEGTPATVPARISATGRLIGRFIFQKTGGTATLIETVWNATLSPTGVTDHGSLAGLSDSDHVVAALSFTATDKLAGRSTAGAGAGEEIACTAAGRALLDDATAAAQLVTLGAPAIWNTVAYDAANFIAGGAMTWGVDDADEIVMYAIVNKIMFLSIKVVSSDVGGVAATTLRMLMPGGYTCAPFEGGHVSIKDAGVWTHGFATSSPTGNAVFFYRHDLTNYTPTAADNTDIRAVLTVLLA